MGTAIVTVYRLLWWNRGLWNQNPFDKIELQGKIPHPKTGSQPSVRKHRAVFLSRNGSISEITEVVYGEKQGCVYFGSDACRSGTIWGLGFPVTQMAIDAQLSSGLIVALRFLIAAAVMGIIFRREVRTITPRDALLGCVAGLILGMAFLLQVMGQSMTTPSNSAFLTSLNVIIVPFLSWGFFHQRPTRKMLLVALGCLVGALVLTLSRAKDCSWASAICWCCAVPWHSRCTSPTWVGLPDASR